MILERVASNPQFTRTSEALDALYRAIFCYPGDGPMQYKRAAIYARVSSDDTRDHKDGRNLTGQLVLCSEYAQAQGYEIVAEFAEGEHGVSGADKEAPQLKQAIEMAQAGRFDVLIVREMDRLARNLSKQLTTEETFEAAGVQIEYALQNFGNDTSGKLAKYVTAAVAEVEKDNIVRRCVDGKLNAVKAGNVLTNRRPPFGRVEVIIDGKRTFGIEPDEAQVIKKMYEWYVQNLKSMTAIAQTLTKQRVPTYMDRHPERKIPPKKRGFGVWSTSMVSRILKNSVNAGVWKYKSPLKGEVASVIIEPIIPLSMFEAAQQRMKDNKSYAARNTKYQYLMARRLKCACGYAMRAKGGYINGRLYTRYLPYHEYKENKYVDCDQSLSYRSDEVDHTVWLWLKNIMTDDKAIQDLWERDLQKRQIVIDDLKQELTNKETQQERAENELASILTQLRDPDTGPASKKILRNQLHETEQLIKRLEGDQQDITAKLNTKVVPEDSAETMMKFLGRLNAKLASNGETFEYKQYVVDVLQVRGVLYRVDDKPKIDIHCLFAYEKGVPIVSTSRERGRWVTDDPTFAEISPRPHPQWLYRGRNKPPQNPSWPLWLNYVCPLQNLRKQLTNRA
jgi:DNA invertase Pin-like site-specific DNA recombinase